MIRYINVIKNGSLHGEVLSIDENGTSKSIGSIEREFKSSKEGEEILFYKVSLNDGVAPKGYKTSLDGLLATQIEWAARTLGEGVPFKNELKSVQVSGSSRLELIKDPEGFYQIHEYNSGALPVIYEKIESFDKATLDLEEIKSISGIEYKEVPKRVEESELAI